MLITSYRNKADFQPFSIRKASAARRALASRLWSNKLVVHYFGKIPEVLTMHMLKSVSIWIQIEQQRRAVEARYVPRLERWLKAQGKLFAADFKAGTGEARSVQMMEYRFENYLPGFYERLYADTYRALTPLTPSMVAMQRKQDWHNAEPWDVPEYVQWMNQVAGQEVRAVTDSTKRGIAKIVDDGIQDHASLDAIANKIQGSYGFSAYRAQVIARTEVVAASNATFFYNVNAYYNVDGATKSWLATNDHRTRPTHVKAGATQKNVPFAENFIVGGAEGMFPGDSKLPGRERIQCCVWDAPVISVGSVKAVTRHKYRGKVQLIRLSGGGEIAVTSNHPILRADGWCGAGRIVQGDYLFRSAFLKLMSATAPDVQARPTLFSQKFDAFQVRGNCDRVLAHDVNFHGDRPQSNVDVVRATSQLRDAVPQPVEHFKFIRTLVLQSALAGACPPRQLAQTSLATTRSIMSGIGEAQAFFDAQTLHTQRIAFADRTPGNTSGLHPSKDGLMVGSVFGGQFFERFAMLVARENFHAAIEKNWLCHVESVREVGYDGYVYNQETETGLYTYSDVITHNCRCTTLYHTSIF